MELLTVREASALLRLKPDTIYRKARHGQIPARRLGRTWRFPKDEISAWIHGRGRSAGGPAAPVAPGGGLALIGAWSAHPDIDGFIREVYRLRRRSTTRPVRVRA